MIITDIVPYTKKQNKIYIDGEFSFILYDKDIHINNIEIGKELSNDEYEHILNEVIYKRGIAYCNYIFARDDKTLFQIQTKLASKLYPKEIIDRIVEYLIDSGFINDERYAYRYVEYKKNKKSTVEIKSKLLERGIDKEKVEDAISKITPENQIEAIEYYIAKKQYKLTSSSDIVGQNKIKKSLAEKGFDYTLIERAFNNIDL